MKNINTILIIALFLFFAYHSIAQNQEKEFPSSNQEITIGIKEDSIAVYALIAEGPSLKETVILLHGLLGNERNLDLAQKLRSAGKNVIFFSYRGAWGSQGEYLYSNCLADVGHVISYFYDSKISSKLRIDTTKLVLIGHSLGGGIALITAGTDNRVKRVIALSAVNYGYRYKDIKSNNELEMFQDYIDACFMLNCKPKKFTQELLDNKDVYNVLTYNKTLKDKPILILDNFDRSDKWASEMKFVDYVVIESDHSFTNTRTELTEYILHWLETN